MASAGWRNDRPRFLHLALFYLAYVLAGGLGQGLSLIPGVSIIFWPPAGIFLGTLLLNPRGSWPWWIATGGLAELTGNAVWFHSALHLALLYYSANVLEVLTAVWLIQRFTPGPFRLESLAEVGALVVGGAIVAPMVGATIIALIDVILGKHPFATAWFLVWLGDGSGLLVSTPLTIVAVHAWQEWRGVPPRRLFEATLLGFMFFAIGVLAFQDYLPTAYVTLPPLLWIAARFQLKGAAVALALVTLLTAAYTIRGAGEFGRETDAAAQQAVGLQIFLAIAAISALVVAVLARQRHETLLELARLNAGLEQRIAERTRELLESEERLRLAVDAGRIGIWRWYPAASKAWMDENTADMFGIDLNGFDGTTATLDRLIHPDDLPLLNAVGHKAARDHTGYAADIRIVRPDGIRWMSVQAIPTLHAAGQIAHFTGVSIDITDRKLAEARTRLLSEAAAVLLSSNDPDAMLKGVFAKIAPALGLDAYFNFMVDDGAETLRLASYTGVPEVVARSLERLEVDQADCENVISQRQPPRACHLQQCDDPLAELVKPLGLRVYVCHPLCAGDQLLGTLSFASRTRDQLGDDELAFLRTICQYVAAVYERLRLVNQLRETDRKKDEFLSVLAHELRNPLAPLRNGLQLMKLADGDADMVEQARATMERQLGQMVRLIDDLMDVTRVSQGKIVLKKQRMLLSTAIHHALDTSRPLIEAARHELLVTLPEVPIYVDADETRLSQIFANLLNNAAKYTVPGGQIRVTAWQDGGQAVVTVADSGVGIPPDMLARVFDMFTQVDRSLEKSQGGLGIGLHLVQQLVIEHRGQIMASSEGHGRGSTFEVRLPIAPTPAGTPPAGDASQCESPDTGRRILVVDDNRDAAITTALMLKLFGHTTKLAHDGYAAAEVAATFQPELVLMDIGMPKLNGYDACRLIRQQPWASDAVFVACTGWGQDEDRRKAEAAGFDHHLVKPIELAELQRILATLAPREVNA